MKNDKNTSISELKQKQLKFVKNRGWDDFQNIRSLAISLSLESNELLDHFQWLNDKEVADFENNKEKIAQISEELADIFSYLLIACSRLHIDLASVFNKKLKKNIKKYPASKFKNLSWEEDNKQYQQSRVGWEKKNKKK